MADDPAPTDKGPVTIPPAPPDLPIGMVTVKLAWPTESFDTGIDGVGVLTRDPAQIPQSALASVIEAASQSNVTVTQIKE